jgi:hypothetical protein
MQSTSSTQRPAARPSPGAREAGTAAARIRESGVACRATIVRSQPLGMRDSTGDDLYALVLSIRVPGRAPSLIQVSDSVSVAAIPLISPGNTLPAKRMPGTDVRDVAIDWAAALAQAAVTCKATTSRI